MNVINYTPYAFATEQVRGERKVQAYYVVQSSLSSLCRWWDHRGWGDVTGTLLDKVFGAEFLSKTAAGLVMPGGSMSWAWGRTQGG